MFLSFTSEFTMDATIQNHFVRCSHSYEGARSIFRLGDDLLQVILSKLPAVSFAFACATCCTFRIICARILSRPKLLSAFSSNPSAEDGIEETLDKLLSEPIRPHFVIANVDHRIKLKKAGEIITSRLGKRVPIICCRPNGVIGREVETGELKNAIWNSIDDQESYAADSNSISSKTCGILVTLGFVPGLKVKIFPLFLPRDPNDNARGAAARILFDIFLDAVQAFTSSISKSSSPLGILVFTDCGANTRHVIETMDTLFDERTTVAGFEGSKIWFASGDSSNGFYAGAIHPIHYQLSSLDVVSLVFAEDRKKPQGVGDIHFNLALSTSLASVGLSYEVIFETGFNRSIYHETYLSARRYDSLETIGGQTIVNDIKNTADDDKYTDLFYCALKRSSVKAGENDLKTKYTFHACSNDKYFGAPFSVEGKGIKTGDSLHIYAPSLKAISESRQTVDKTFKNWKVYGTPSWKSTSHSRLLKDQVFGGFMCASIERKNPFFGGSDADSSCLLNFFPNIAFAGVYCSKEIARGHATREQYPSPCHVRTCSCAYFLMSYAPPPKEGS